MTTGAKHDVGPDYRTYSVNELTGATTELGTVHTGFNFDRIWTGTDSPSPKPVDKTNVFKFNKKTYVIRRRADGTRPNHHDDHPYTTTRSYKVSNPYNIKTFGQDGGFPVNHRILIQSEYRDTVTTLGVGFSVTQKWSSNDDIALLGKLRDKIAGSDFNAGVFLGEGREALHMIAQNATKIYRGFKAARKGNFIGAADILMGLNRSKSIKRPSGRFTDLKGDVSLGSGLTAAAQIWLELQYGWLPLLKDIYSGAQFLATRMNLPAEQVYKARHKRQHLMTPNNIWIESAGGGYKSGQIIAKITEVNEAALAGLLDPASVAWELLPWSFVCDWFIPIGNYLQARALPGAISGRFITTYTTKTVTLYSGLRSLNMGNPVTWPTVVYDGIAGYTNVTDVIRTVSTTLSVPLPSFKGLMEVPSWRRAFNAVSLIITGNSRGFR